MSHNNPFEPSAPIKPPDNWKPLKKCLKKLLVRIVVQRGAYIVSELPAPGSDGLIFASIYLQFGFKPRH